MAPSPNDDLFDLYPPLVRHLLPISYRESMEGNPLRGRSIKLRKADFKQQHEKGIDRCVGYDIMWID